MGARLALRQVAESANVPDDSEVAQGISSVRYDVATETPMCRFMTAWNMVVWNTSAAVVLAAVVLAAGAHRAPADCRTQPAMGDSAIVPTRPV